MPDTKKSIQLKEIWKEMKDWRRYWKTSNFFKALFFGFAFSLFDVGSDFNFAWSVPTECPTYPPLGNFSSCGMLHPKQVELFTYFFISHPAFYVGLALLFNILKEVISQ